MVCPQWKMNFKEAKQLFTSLLMSVLLQRG